MNREIECCTIQRFDYSTVEHLWGKRMEGKGKSVIINDEIVIWTIIASSFITLNVLCEVSNSDTYSPIKRITPLIIISIVFSTRIQ